VRPKTRHAIRQAAGVRRVKENEDARQLQKIVRLLDKATAKDTPTVKAYNEITKAARQLRQMKEPDLNKLAGLLEQGAKGLKDAIDQGSRSYDQIDKTIAKVKQELQQEKTGRDRD
jgi:hypothetical protein